MTPVRPDWLGEGDPELRDGPPWAMGEMIAAEPGLARQVAAAPGATAVAEVVARARAAGEPVVVVGCGTSEHGAAAIAEQLDGALRAGGGPGGAVEARQAFEAALDPRRGGVCIGVSHEGSTAATVRALTAAGAAGATTVLVTAVPDAPAAASVDLVLPTPLVDRSWCHTVGYVSPILAGGAVAAALRGTPLAPDAVAALVAAGVAGTDGPAAVARALHGVERLVVCGSGLDRIAARELVLKVEEGLHLPAAMRDTETFLHGHLPAGDERTGLVLIAADPSARADRERRGRGLLAAARRVGVRTAAVVAAGAGAGWEAELTSAGRVELPSAGAPPGVPPDLAALLGAGVALQRLTLALVAEAGTNPDLIRREQAPWREAAALAGADDPSRAGPS